MKNHKDRIPASVRFQVLRRDDFTCRYCGKRPPDAELVIDHIQALAHGGEHTTTNLATSCWECNAGKGSTDMLDPPMSLAEVITKTINRMEESHKRALRQLDYGR